MKMECVLFLCMLIVAGVSGQFLEMNEEKYFFSGGKGDQVDIHCQSSDFPERCFFYSPDGKLVCGGDDVTSAYDEEIYDYSDEDCVEDPDVKIIVRKTFKTLYDFL